MKFFRPIALTTALTFLGTAAWAVDQDDHKAHHPELAAPSSQTPAGGAGDAVAKTPTPNMMAMSDMHDKMMNAKTPEERQAVMADHMKGMPMMGGSRDGKNDMGGMSGMGQGQMKGGMPSDRIPPASK